uniref:Uncharacterized protein n=1 Tax=Urocitellus parryii TaxID=9999 RepID=A0A8D2IBL1_UROPR
MSVLTPLLLRGLTGRPSGSSCHTPRSIPSHHEQLRTTDVATGPTSCFLCVLLLASGVLSHLEIYKKQE